MEELINSFEDSILDPHLDLSTDVTNISAEFLSITGFPLYGFLIKTVSTTAKVLLSVRDKWLIYKTYATAQALNSRTIDPYKLEKYRKKLKNPKYAMEEAGRLLELIDQSTEVNKCRILGRIYNHYINEELTFEQFYELTEALHRMFTIDHDELIIAHKNGSVGMETENSYRLDRLIAVGLLENKNRVGDFILKDNGDLYLQTTNCTLTKLGELYCKYGLEL